MSEVPRKSAAEYRIVVGFPNGDQRVHTVTGHPAARQQYHRSLQAAARLGGWVTVFDSEGVEVSMQVR